MTDAAARLAARLDALATALHRSGAPPDEVARLLELASVATLQAVHLELVLAEHRRTFPPAAPAAAPPAELRAAA